MRTLTLQARIDGQHKRTDVLGIPALTQDQARDAWNSVGNAAMYGRLARLAQYHKLNNTRHRAGVIGDVQFDRALGRTMLRLKNIQYWNH